MSTHAALVVGVGPGLGWAAAKRLAKSGRKVAVSARSQDALEQLIASEPSLDMKAYASDATDPAAVTDLFERVEKERGELDVVVVNASAFMTDSILTLEPSTFEKMWRVGCFSGFLVGQAAAKRMAARGRGTIIFTGATAGIRGGASFAAFAAAKFGLRAVAQSMARELGPKGVHVAHVVIDGIIDAGRSAAYVAGKGPDAGLSADAIAETYLHLVDQPRSAWTHELDLRPYAERF